MSMTPDSPRSSSELGRRVFEVIADRYVRRADDIALFTATQYSFEEWLNWEALAACRAVSGWRVEPKPSYARLGAAECGDYGDLLVTSADASDRVLVEVGLMHDGTGMKWRDKLNWDASKLCRKLEAEVCPLHIIVLASAMDVSSSAGWRRWLERLECWNRPEQFERSCKLGPRGELIVRAWAMKPTSGHPESSKTVAS